VSSTAKVALINPPILEEVFRHQPYLPIGLAYLAAVLERESHEVKIIDCLTLRINCEKLKTEISAFDPEVVGITAMTPTINSAFAAAHAVKEATPNALVVTGGPHATFMDEQILHDVADIDIVARGEGEQTITEIVQKVANREKLYDVAGITVRKDGKVIRTADRSYIENLDELPYPSLKHFSLENYRVFGRKILPVITSRGCPFQCSFCITSRVFGKKTRMRTSENVVNELEWLKNEHGADAYSFFDDTFTLDKHRVHKICDEIINRKINVPWDCQTRVDQITPEILAKMKKAGCEIVTFGIESGCQRILDAINKKTSVEQNERGIKMVKKAGLSVVTSVIIGFPGETLDTIKETLGFIQRLKPDDAYVCIATPYPGTELYRIVKENGWKISPDWSKYDTVTPVFENPLVSNDELLAMRKKFYDDFYSPAYIFRQMTKGKFYNHILARIALNHVIWRMKAAL
jgi:anaerobic magnesium-protoporphyrin IX monomethyl ester cyclase